jgi:hypothetical protein
MVAMSATPRKEDSAELVMYNDNAGGERVALRAHDDGAALTFFPAKGKVAQVLSLGADKDGSMNLLLEEKGRTKIVLGSGPKGEAAVRVQSKDGKTIFEVSNP